MIYKKNTLRRAAAAAAAICLAFAFAFAEETGADRLGFGTSVTVSAADDFITVGTTAKLYYTVGANDEITITQAIAVVLLFEPDNNIAAVIFCVCDLEFRALSGELLLECLKFLRGFKLNGLFETGCDYSFHFSDRLSERHCSQIYNIILSYQKIFFKGDFDQKIPLCVR